LIDIPGQRVRNVVDDEIDTAGGQRDPEKDQAQKVEVDIGAGIELAAIRKAGNWSSSTTTPPTSIPKEPLQKPAAVV
jgi:hypothetical protein